MSAPDDGDTVTVTATVLCVQRCEAGRLLALADVEIEIAGVVLTLHGVRIVKTGPREKAVGARCFRLATGRVAEPITLRPELASAIAAAALDEYERRPLIAGRRPSSRCL